MDDLLPHYERELAFLRDRAGDFSQRYPKIAGRLMLSGDVGEDPHVERLIESFALLTARVHKRLDDDFPLFTETFLDVLYPHYLRPFPSCAIACFAREGAKAMAGADMAAGTPLKSHPVKGVTCQFRTAAPVQLLPLRVASARFSGAISAPAGTPVPAGATTLLSIELALTQPEVDWTLLGTGSLRLYLDGEASQVTVLREALLGRVAGVLLQRSAAGAWTALPKGEPRAVGFGDDEALIDTDARTHRAYRLLTEYFAFPEKFNFIDLPLPLQALHGAPDRITLHLALSGVRTDSDDARLLETVSERNLLPGCTPVVNLFEQKADPIRVTHASASYPVLPEGRQAFGHEVYSIDKVYRVKTTPQGEEIDAFQPFYSLLHEELLAEGEEGGRYWHVHRDDGVAAGSPGHETEISIVDLHFNPALAQTETLSLDVTATNRELPSLLSVGNAGGDLFMCDGSSDWKIRLLRKPTPSLRFARGRGALWRLISHLSVNHLSLSGGGIDALKEMLRLYDLRRSPITQRLIDGLLKVEFRSASACLPGDPFPAFVRGTEVRLTVDESRFVGSGLRLFAEVMDHFFGLYTHLNSFTQVRLLSSRTQEELIACPRRSGTSPLV